MDPFQLPMEKEFSIHAMAEQIKSLSAEEMQDVFISIYRQMLMKEQYYQTLIQEKWTL